MNKKDHSKEQTTCGLKNKTNVLQSSCCALNTTEYISNNHGRTHQTKTIVCCLLSPDVISYSTQSYLAHYEIRQNTNLPKNFSMCSAFATMAKDRKWTGMEDAKVVASNPHRLGEFSLPVFLICQECE